MENVGMKVTHKKYGAGEIINFLPPKEYEPTLMNSYVNRYKYIPVNDGVYEVKFDNEETVKLFPKKSIGTFLFPDNIDMETGEIID